MTVKLQIYPHHHLICIEFAAIQIYMSRQTFHSIQYKTITRMFEHTLHRYRHTIKCFAVKKIHQCLRV